MKNEYGYVLTAITEKFKARIKELANDIKSFGKEAEKETTVTPKLSTTGYQKQIEYVKAQMQEIQDVLVDRDKMEPMDVAKLEADYETLSYKLGDLLEKQEEFNSELDDTNDKASGMSINLGGMFDKSIGKIKRFTFYLLGARSVFSLFMKYQGIYYQYNEKLQYQSELSQNAIALSLAPAFEFLGNVIAYASIAFAKFIELLTGVNVLSKVSTKGIRDYNKALKESQSLLSGIDEITNLTLPSSTGLASQYQALDDFKKKIEEVNKWFEENKWTKDLADGLKTIWNWLKKLYKYIKDHWDIFKYIIGGVALASIFGGTGNLAFSISVLGLGTFLSYVTALQDYNKAKKEYDENNKKTHDLIMNNFKEMTNYLLNDTKEALKGVEKGTKLWEERTADVKKQLPSILQEIENGKLTYEEYKPVIDEWITELRNLDGEKFKPEIDFLTQLDGDDEDIALIKAYYSTGSPNVKLGTGGGGLGAYGGGGSFGGRELNYKVNVEEDNKNNITNFANRLDGFLKKKYTLKINTQILTEIGKGATAGANAISQAVAKAIRGYASGLDYVPYDNYPALLHKGEAVVPAKYNPEIHGMGNQYTNSLLETLIVKIDDLSKRPNVFEIDGQKFANATYGLYEQTKNNQNYAEGVIR